MIKKKKDTGNDKPIFPRLGTLNFIEFSFCCLNSVIGTGALQLGSTFTSGLAFTHILNIFVALVSLYSLKLYVLSASIFHESTFEEIWAVTFPKCTIFIPALCSVILSITNVMSYLTFLQGSAISILTMIILLINENSQETINKINEFKFLIGFLIVVVFCVPTSISSNLRFVVMSSFISVSFFLCIIIYVIIRFSIIVSDKGFDPNHRIKAVDLKDHISSSISSLTYAYLFYPFAWPGLRHSKNPSQKNLSITFYTVISVVFILYTIMGTFSYLTFFDENTGGIILDYYPYHTQSEKIQLIIGHIITFIYILLTIPIVLNSARYILLNCIHKKDEFPLEVWAPVGITMSLVSLILANIADNISNVIYIISDILTLIQLFIFPPLLYLRGFGTRNKLHFIGSILEIALGIAAISFMIYADCFE